MKTEKADQCGMTTLEMSILEVRREGKGRKGERKGIKSVQMARVSACVGLLVSCKN